MSENWKIETTNAVCWSCSAKIEEESDFFSLLITEEETFVRRDLCLSCWKKDKWKEQAFAFWRTTRKPKEAPLRKYAHIDIPMVWSIFSSMNDTVEDKQEKNVRYLLALMLLRRRFLRLKQSRENLLVLEDRNGTRYHVEDPVLNEEQMNGLTSQLHALLWEREFSDAT